MFYGTDTRGTCRSWNRSICSVQFEFVLRNFTASYHDIDKPITREKSPHITGPPSSIRAKSGDRPCIGCRPPRVKGRCKTGPWKNDPEPTDIWVVIVDWKWYPPNSMPGSEKISGPRFQKEVESINLPLYTSAKYGTVSSKLLGIWRR